MKNLRGRPRNISDSGIIYVNSDSEDSDFSDSDVEPAIFPLDLEVDGVGGPQEVVVLFESVDNISSSSSYETSEDEDDAVPIMELRSNENNELVIPVNGNQQDNEHNRETLQAVRSPIVHENLESDTSNRQESDSTIDLRAVPGRIDLRNQANLTNNNNSEAENSIEQLVNQVNRPEQQQSCVNQTTSTSANLEESENSANLEESSNSAKTTQEITTIPIPIVCVSPSPTSNHNQISTSVKTTMTDQNQRDAVTTITAPEEHVIDTENSFVTEVQILGADANRSTPLCSQAKEISSSSSLLVPYPDLPDYASGISGDEEEEGDSQKARFGDGDLGSKDFARLNDNQEIKGSKRKAFDATTDDDSKDFSDYRDSKKSSPSVKEKCDQEQSECEEEETCNPMVSDVEECDENEEAFRGDRIGNTVYSERHILKILMKWIKELPQYSLEKLDLARESSEPEEAEIKVQRLEREFEEQMSLLWDMSAETDVMKFLVENKIFTFIRDTLDRSACNRLTEIALGILANVISEPSIIEDFTVHDSSIQLVERVVDLTPKVANVAVLIQIFSVLRRIAWYLRNVAHVKKWTDLFQSTGFLGCANFIMSSSTNALLLGTVVTLFFTLLECLNPENNDNEEDQLDEDQADYPHCSSKSTLEEKKTERLEQLTKNYEPFCKSQFVPSICEGLKELLKNPKPPNARQKLTSTREKPPGPSGGQTDDPNADDIDVFIPEGHVQQAILNGLSTLALLQKAPNGQDALKVHAQQVINFLHDFYARFIVVTEAVTRSTSLEYFALSLHLLSFSHTSLAAADAEAIISPISTASKLMSQEQRDKEVDLVIRVQLKDGVEFDSVSYIALVAHEYLAAVAERFGPDCALKVRSSENHSRFFKVLDEVVAKFSEESESNKDNRGDNLAT